MNDTDKISWKGWLAAEKPYLTLFAVSVLTAVWILSFTFLQSAVVSTLLTFCVFAYVSEFFLPVDYGLDSDSAWKKIGPVMIKKQWTQLRSFYTDKNGVLISPFTKPSRLETFRGIYLRFADADKEAVLFTIKKQIEKNTENK